MLRTDVAEDLRREFGEGWALFPDYEGYCFANVPHTVTSLLGVETGRTLPGDALSGVPTDGVGTVLVVLVDGFGFRQWRRERDRHPFLDRLSSTARVTPLTSVYPSETAAAMTTFHTGALPAEHGVVGWNVYEPTADEEFEALPFETKDGEQPRGVARDEVAEAEPLYPELADAGVDAHHVAPFETGTEGATVHAYESLADFPARLREAVGAAERPSYCFAYLDHVDAAAHESGTDADSYRETVGAAFGAVEAALSGLDADAAEDALLVVTADHGHVNTDPERNVNLDRRGDLLDALARRDGGAPVKFSGSMRNVHLHLREDSAAADDRTADSAAARGAPEVVADLRSDLDARVFERGEVLDRELFGDATPSETFRRRLGDAVVSHRDLGVWWGDEEPEELGHVGMHGGLHPDEMLVPFAAVRADGLIE